MDPLKTRNQTREAADTAHSPAQAPDVDAALQRVLSSPAFRKSEQCRKFLAYVAEHSHRGEDELLKERSIGAEVFGRPPDYDTAEDPVVRVRATEVRKRLAQYYGETGATDEVRFEIPAGSYRVDIHTFSRNAGGAAPVRERRSRRLSVGIGVGVIIAIAAGLVLWRSAGPRTVADQFWSPVMSSTKPVFLYCGQPVVYFLSRSVHDKYRDRVSADKRRGSYALTLDPNETIRGGDIIPVSDQFVGIGNAHTAAMLAGMFAERRKPVEIRYANDLSFSDLRSSPAVLIGAFSNLWTLEMQDALRFVFEQENGTRRIRDRSENKTWQLANLAPDGKTSEDYAVVSRLFDSETGQVLISAAGITQYGTRAAGEFLTSEASMRTALAQAPADWPKRNLQVLLHTTVYKGTPAPPRLVAKHVW